MGKTLRPPAYGRAKPQPQPHPDPAMRKAPERQEGHPNLNRGGNEGNVYGAGRLRKAVRERCVSGFDEGLTDLVNVANGRAWIEDTDIFGRKFKRKPNQEERFKAMDMLAKYGLGTRIDATSDDAPLKAYVAIDLGKVRGDADPDA